MERKSLTEFIETHHAFLEALLQLGSIRSAAAATGISYQRGQQIAKRVGYRVEIHRFLGDQLLPDMPLRKPVPKPIPVEVPTSENQLAKPDGE